MESIPAHSFKKVLPASSCGPAFKLCLPSEVVTHFMSKFIEVDFELRDGATQNCWRVSIGPRRNKAKFEYLLLGWRSVCEQSKMQVGDEVQFHVFDTHMGFRVVRSSGACASTQYGPQRPQHGQDTLYTPPGANCSDENLYLQQIRQRKECPEFQPAASSCVSWPLVPPPQLCTPPSFMSTSQGPLDLPYPPRTLSRSNPRENLDQVLSLSTAPGLEESLDSEMKEPMSSFFPLSSSLKQKAKQTTMTTPEGDSIHGDTNLPYDSPTRSPVSGQSHAKVTPSSASGWPLMAQRSIPEAPMSWVPHHPPQNGRPGKAVKRSCTDSPWMEESSAEPFPFTESCKSRASQYFVKPRTASARGPVERHLQGSSPSDGWMKVLQGSLSMEMDGEFTTIKKALQKEKDRADQAEEVCAQLLQAMQGAELVVERQTSLGLEGVSEIVNAANQLVSAEMLRYLDLAKAQGLGALQAQLRQKANSVLEALVQMQALTGRQKLVDCSFSSSSPVPSAHHRLQAPQEFEHMESKAPNHREALPQSPPW